MCEAHNLVNIRLDKPEFECTLDNLKDLYKVGHKKKEENWGIGGIVYEEKERTFIKYPINNDIKKIM